jgi:hypothetical protein
MKIIDQTPFYKENGELSMVDRGKALMKFGAGWFKEIEGQNSIIAVLDKILDKKFVLLRNITPPGLDTMIPFILVGPTGAFVMSVTAQTGTFRARGDQWGTISGGNFKPEKINLLTRTDRMARAVQVFLKRQGYADISGVESILLCSDATTNIDSMRPIIRVIMRDALERFAVSITQGRVVFTPEIVFDIVNRIQHPPASSQPAPVEAEADGSTPGGSEPADAHADQPASQAVPFSAEASVLPDQAGTIPDSVPAVRPRRGVTKKQALFLVIMLVVWCLIVAVFLLLIRDNLLSLFQ